MARSSWIILCVTTAMLAGCAKLGPGQDADPSPPPKTPAAPPAPPTPEQVREAFTRLNSAFQNAYERIIKKHGARVVAARRTDAFDALQAGLVRLGMIVENSDPDIGVLTVAAPAPKPLDAAEWRTTVQADQPMMASILCPVLGEYCKTLKFEPDDFVIVINATVRALDADRSAVFLTTRMREIAQRPGVPRREYPPPTGVQMALDKIWAQFDRALAERQARPAGQKS
jgi:hypothetical protein